MSSVFISLFNIVIDSGSQCYTFVANDIAIIKCQSFNAFSEISIFTTIHTALYWRKYFCFYKFIHNLVY